MCNTASPLVALTLEPSSDLHDVDMLRCRRFAVALNGYTFGAMIFGRSDDLLAWRQSYNGPEGAAEYSPGCQPGVRWEL